GRDKLSMTTMGCQSLVIVRLTRSDGICGIGEATSSGTENDCHRRANRELDCGCPDHPAAINCR
ncbi:hypothetical protein C7D73_30215, partial [Klebsiella pneumoniae]